MKKNLYLSLNENYIVKIGKYFANKNSHFEKEKKQKIFSQHFPMTFPVYEFINDITEHACR